MRKDSITFSTAHNLVKHARDCCRALLDGTVKMPRRDPAYWLARLDLQAKYWRYPVVTPAIEEACATLGVKLDDDIQQLSGVQQLSAFLKAIDSPLTEILTRAPATRCTISVESEFAPDAYQDAQTAKIPEIFAPIQEHDLPGVSLFLHGSMADLQYTPFSDIDDLVILRKSVWENPETLMRTASMLAQLAREFQNVDPLQHHGHWLLTDFDLLWYEQSYIPLVVLDTAVRVVGEQEIAYRVNHDTSGFIKNAINTIRSTQHHLMQAKRNGGLNAFHLKGLIGELALMPAYLFQARGEIISKAEAIARADELYPLPALEALEWATMVREEFKPLVCNARTRILSKIAELFCARRQHADSLFRSFATFVGNDHPLGLSTEVLATIEIFVSESNSLVTELRK